MPPSPSHEASTREWIRHTELEFAFWKSHAFVQLCADTILVEELLRLVDVRSILRPARSFNLSSALSTPLYLPWMCNSLCLTAPLWMDHSARLSVESFLSSDVTLQYHPTGTRTNVWMLRSKWAHAKLLQTHFEGCWRPSGIKVVAIMMPWSYSCGTIRLVVYRCEDLHSLPCFFL